MEKIDAEPVEVRREVVEKSDILKCSDDFYNGTVCADAVFKLYNTENLIRCIRRRNHCRGCKKLLGDIHFGDTLILMSDNTVRLVKAGDESREGAEK